MQLIAIDRPLVKPKRHIAVLWQLENFNSLVYLRCVSQNINIGIQLATSCKKLLICLALKKDMVLFQLLIILVHNVFAPALAFDCDDNNTCAYFVSCMCACTIMDIPCVCSSRQYDDMLAFVFIIHIFYSELIGSHMETCIGSRMETFMQSPYATGLWLGLRWMQDAELLR